MSIANTNLKKIAVLFFGVWMSVSGTASASDIGFGFGHGGIYNGIGFNLTLQGDRNFKHITVGCLGLSFGGSSDSGAFEGDRCGIGAGIVFFSSSPAWKNHAFGYSGLISKNENDDDNDAEFGIGLNYLYFLGGYKSSGVTLGASAVLSFFGDEGTSRGLINIGYQFK